MMIIIKLLNRSTTTTAPQLRRHFSGDGAKRTKGPRNTKNFDWYSKAVERQSTVHRSLEPIECFPAALGPRSRAFFELSSGGTSLGRLTFVLCDDILPKTCENFKLLCEGSKTEFKYENSIIHRIVRNQLLMGGDVEMLIQFIEASERGVIK